MPGTTPTVASIVGCSLVYATVRYNVFKGVPWSDWPVFILNKALAVSSILLVLAYVVRSRRGLAGQGADLLGAAWKLMLVHAGLSLAILSPGYFPTFFNGDKLSWQAGVSMSLGVVAAMGLGLNGRKGDARPTLLTGAGVVALLAGLHCAFYGYAGWFDPATWPGRLPPITLISSAAAVAAMLLALGSRGSSPGPGGAAF